MDIYFSFYTLFFFFFSWNVDSESPVRKTMNYNKSLEIQDPQADSLTVTLFLPLSTLSATVFLSVLTISL